MIIPIVKKSKQNIQHVPLKYKGTLLNSHAASKTVHYLPREFAIQAKLLCNGPH